MTGFNAGASAAKEGANTALAQLLQRVTQSQDNQQKAKNQSDLETQRAAAAKDLQQSGIEGQGANEQTMAKLQALLKGQATQQDIQSLKALKDSGAIGDATGAKVGDVSVTSDPMARLALQGPQQAAKFQGIANKAYGGLNDQLDASKNTVDYLNQGNASADKLAIINEARLAAGQGGSRALTSIMQQMTGGKSIGSDAQSIQDYFNNTPNVPTLQPAQRDALRETVMNRIGSLQDQAGKIKQQLASQGPSLAPQTDYNSIINSYDSPVQQKLSGLSKMQSDYKSGLGQLKSAPASTPSTADSSGGVLDKLKSFFTGAPQGQPTSVNQPPQTAPVPPPTASPQLQMPSFDDFKKWKASQAQAASQAPQQGAPSPQPAAQSFAYGGEVKKTLGSQIGYPGADANPPQQQSKPAPKPSPSNVPTAQSDNSSIGHAIGYPGMAKGGIVPGHPLVPGDSPANDTETIHASPGELVIPNHIMQSEDPVTHGMNFIKQHIANKGRK